MLKSYGLNTVTGDRYGGQWPRERFQEHGIEYKTSDHTKSAIYTELLPLLNSGRVELLDHRKLVSQIVGLQRRTARGGKDSIDHSPGGFDDLINSAAGALVLAAKVERGVPEDVEFYIATRPRSESVIGHFEVS